MAARNLLAQNKPLPAQAGTGFTRSRVQREEELLVLGSRTAHIGVLVHPRRLAGNGRTQLNNTPYQLLLWAATREAARARHRNDASTMVTMIGEIDHERYSTLPPLLALLLLHYQARIGAPPASRQQDLALAAVKKRSLGANPHPTRARDTRRRP